MKIKTNPQTTMPGFEKIKDELVRTFGHDLSEMLMNSMRNTYDDIVALEKTERVTSFPTANLDSRGKLILVEGTGGGADGLFLCHDVGGGVYGWGTVTIT